MNYAENNEIIRKHLHDNEENLCIAVLSIIPLRETFFNEDYSYSRSSQKYSRTSVEIRGLFMGIPQFFNFQGLFRARAKHDF